MQQKHMRKEWDLNDPDTLKKERPARDRDDDPTLGAELGVFHVFELCIWEIA